MNMFLGRLSLCVFCQKDKKQVDKSKRKGGDKFSVIREKEKLCNRRKIME